MRIIVISFIFFYVLPVVIAALIYRLRTRGDDWRSADRSSARLLPAAQLVPEAIVRIFSARTVSWRGIVATHSWVVIKDTLEPAYERFDYTAWGAPIWKDRFVADGRWFGSEPEVVYAANGAEAARLIPIIRTAIREYRFPSPGDYHLWPGPNSNTFVAAVMHAAAIRVSLPCTAIGKDFPYSGHWAGWSPSKTGIRLNIGGYFGLMLGWYEGFELNLFGAVAGFDIRRPALKLPALGRIGAALHRPLSAVTGGRMINPQDESHS